MSRLNLTSWQRQRLRRQLADTPDARLYRRTLAVLEFDFGRPAADIARMLGVTRQSVYHWVETYLQARDPTALADEAGRGRHPLLDEDQEHLLEALLAVSPQDLGYPPELAHVPEAAVESFAGVANPWTLGRLASGERVLDLGSGAGTDSLIAAQMVGPQGRVVGIDMTPEMLAKARVAAAAMEAANVEFVEGEAEQLPFADHSFDVVISNGVIDLIPDKDLVFAELYRVLVPGGRMQIADVTIQNPVSDEGRRNIDLWTG